MTDWLSELGWDCESLAHTDEGRMARVIKELARCIRAGHAEEDAHLSIDIPADFRKIVKEREDAWDDLSPDAKELLK